MNNNSTNASLEFSTGQVLGKFKVEEKLSSGNFGTVYRVTQLGLSRSVALKVLHGNVNDEGMHRFQREAKAAKNFVHDNLAIVYEFGILPDCMRPYIAMQLIEGESLASRLKRTGQLSAEEAMPIFLQIASGLSYAHKQDVLHRDIKPENIMLVMGEDKITGVKLVDFGLCRPTGDWAMHTLQVTRMGHTVGSPPYMSPEQCTGKEVDERSDIYSLGCTMFEAIAGTPPFMGESALECLQKHLYATLPDFVVRTGSAQFAHAVKTIICKCLEKDPANRYKNAAALEQDIRSALESDHSDDREFPTEEPRKSSASTGNGHVGSPLLVDPASVTGKSKQRGSTIIIGLATIIMLAGYLCYSWPGQRNDDRLSFKADQMPTVNFFRIGGPARQISQCWFANANSLTKYAGNRLDRNIKLPFKPTAFTVGPHDTLIVCDGPKIYKLGLDGSLKLLYRTSQSIFCVRLLDDVLYFTQQYEPTDPNLQRVRQTGANQICSIDLHTPDKVTILDYPRYEHFDILRSFTFDSKGQLVVLAKNPDTLNFAIIFGGEHPTGKSVQSRYEPYSWDLDLDDHIVFLNESDAGTIIADQAFGSYIHDEQYRFGFDEIATEHQRSTLPNDLSRLVPQKSPLRIEDAVAKSQPELLSQLPTMSCLVSLSTHKESQTRNLNNDTAVALGPTGIVQERPCAACLFPFSQRIKDDPLIRAHRLWHSTLPPLSCYICARLLGDRVFLTTDDAFFEPDQVTCIENGQIVSAAATVHLAGWTRRIAFDSQGRLCTAFNRDDSIEFMSYHGHTWNHIADLGRPPGASWQLVNFDVDDSGRLWFIISDSSKLYRYDPKTNSTSSFELKKLDPHIQELLDLQCHH